MWYCSETAVLYSSNEKELKQIDYLINNKYQGGGGALGKNILQPEQAALITKL